MQIPAWVTSAFVYHIYPLGLTGAPARNDFHSASVERLNALYDWLDPIQALGADTLYLGPLFESTAHGYDTADYYHIDRRLGDRATLRRFSQELHRRGMRLVLDGVFNHVGRDFWAFRDLRQHGPSSAYRDWFAGLDFGQGSPYGDPFRYQGWSGHYDLVKLNLAHEPAARHLLDAVSQWVEDYDIDGLRLDAADQLSPDFVQQLAAHARGLRSDFWLMGEIVFGDYRRLLGPERLHSVTNYELYKALYSSHNDRNYPELAYALNRQFGPGGLYRDQPLYSFADNHDVNRVASALKRPAHLYPLYCLLFSLPGIPSVYYGSEWGLTGERSRTSDAALRPAIDLRQPPHWPQPELPGVIARLAAVRRATPALQAGEYRELLVSSQQMAFLRSAGSSQAVVAVNAADRPATVRLRVPPGGNRWDDHLNPGESFYPAGGEVELTLPPLWGRILVAS
jgi:glycosidase